MGFELIVVDWGRADGRFAVANVLDEDVKQLGDRLRQLNEIMGMDEADE